MWPFNLLNLSTHLAALAAGVWITAEIMAGNCQSKLESQAQTIQSQCNETAKTLKEANDELQRSQANIAGRLAKYKRMQPSACVTVSKGSVDAASGSGYVGAHELLDYAAECEQYRQQRITLEGLLK